MSDIVKGDSVIYLDNNATTRVAPEVVEVMLPLFSELYGNASSMHTFGGQMSHFVNEARANVAGLLGARPEEIVFTSCGTESDSTAVFSAVETQPEKKHFITTRVEHPAVIALGNLLEKRGYDVTWLGVDSRGRLDLDELARSIRKDTALVSIMYANNETGTVFPVDDIARIVKERGALLHVDAVQAVGKEPIDLSRTPIDFLALSGHKLHAPKGVGVLYVRKGTRFPSLPAGGASGAWKTCGDGKCAVYRGVGQGLRACRICHGTGAHAGGGPARQAGTWSACGHPQRDCQRRCGTQIAQYVQYCPSSRWKARPFCLC